MTAQRISIAWCGECGNVSVDGINFGRDGLTGDLSCGRCGAVSPHFEYIRKSAIADAMKPKSKASA